MSLEAMMNPNVAQGVGIVRYASSLSCEKPIKMLRDYARPSQYPITGIMPVGPYEGQVPVREYEEDRVHEGRMQLIEITVKGHQTRPCWK
jgi:hypothetical protein